MVSHVDYITMPIILCLCHINKVNLQFNKSYKLLSLKALSKVSTNIYLHALKKSFGYNRLSFRNSSNNSARTTNGTSFARRITYGLRNKAILLADGSPRCILTTMALTGIT